MKEFFKGLSAYRQTLIAISNYGLWGFVLLPGLLGVLIGGFIFYAAYQLSGTVGTKLVGWYPDHWWGNDGIDTLGAFLGGGLLIALSLVLFKYIMLVVVSPFMSFLSERIEKGMNPNYVSKPFHIGRFSKEFWRSIRLAMRNIVRELSVTFLLLLLGLIPVFAPFTSILIFMIGAYYAGFGSIDYTLERHFSYRESIRFIHQNRGLTLGIGTGFMLILLIPFIGVFFAPTFACIAATLQIAPQLQHPDNQGIR